MDDGVGRFLRAAVSIDKDASNDTGYVKVVTVAEDGSLILADAHGRVRALNVRDELQRGCFSAQSRGERPRPAVAPRRVYRPLPDRAQVITHVAARHCHPRTWVALCGYDPDSLKFNPVVRVLCLDEAQRKGSVDTVPPEITYEVDATEVGVDFFRHMRGGRVVHAAFHPASAEPLLCVLTTGGTFATFDVVRDPARPATTVSISDAVRRGFVGGLSAQQARPQPTSFALGTGAGWAAFAAYFLFSDGGVYCVSPIAPLGMILTKRERDEMRERVDGQVGSSWLDDVLEPMPAPVLLADVDSGAMALSGRYKVDRAGRAACVAQGPLEAAEGEGSDGAGRWSALLAVSHRGCTALVRATDGGRLATGLLVGEPMPVFPPPAGPERGAGGLTRTPAGPDSVSILPVDVAIALAPDDSDDDSDEDSDDERSGGGDWGERWPALLLPDASGGVPGLFACHVGGVHAVSLPWLQKVADYVSAAADGISGQQLQRLPETSATYLRGGAAARAVMAATHVGDRTTMGCAVLCLGRDGTADLVRLDEEAGGGDALVPDSAAGDTPGTPLMPPSPAARSPSTPGSAFPRAGAPAEGIPLEETLLSSEAERRIRAELAETYDFVFSWRAPDTPRQAPAQDASTTAGANALAKAAFELNESHVKFCELAHALIEDRSQAMLEEARRAAEQVVGLRKRYTEHLDTLEECERRLRRVKERANRSQGDVQEVLAQLRGRPVPLTSAERAAQGAVAAARAVGSSAGPLSVQEMRREATEARKWAAQCLHDAPRPLPSHTPPAPPAAGTPLRQLRSAGRMASLGSPVQRRPGPATPVAPSTLLPHKDAALLRETQQLTLKVARARAEVLASGRGADGARG
ncbi:unnamed protein product [Pedinophyceae sp. YPF-701]|nr:unnamed protein product [Pedinophyceae sp. YPF-701]